VDTGFPSENAITKEEEAGRFPIPLNPKAP
jgi:hypothetical protein